MQDPTSPFVVVLHRVYVPVSLERIILSHLRHTQRLSLAMFPAPPMRHTGPAGPHGPSAIWDTNSHDGLQSTCGCWQRKTDVNRKLLYQMPTAHGAPTGPRDHPLRGGPLSPDRRGDTSWGQPYGPGFHQHIPRGRASMPDIVDTPKVVYLIMADPVLSSASRYLLSLSVGPRYTVSRPLHLRFS